MRSLIAAIGCVFGTGALLGLLAFSENRDVTLPLTQGQRFPEVCEQYVAAFEACNADALEASARLASSGQVGDEDAIYIQRQLNQLRRELARVQNKGGDAALVSHCTDPQFEDINHRLIRQIASSLLEVNAMHVACASAVGRVIQSSYGDPENNTVILDSMEASSAVASISAVPNNLRK